MSEVRLIDANALKKALQNREECKECTDIDCIHCFYDIIDNAPTVELQIERMTLGDMLRTLRTSQYERIEVRDIEGNEIFTCPASSEGIMSFKDYEVIEWFPHGAPNKDATFTVYVRSKEMQNEP